MIHEPCRPGQTDWYEDYNTLTGPAAELPVELKTEGFIKYTGLGGTTVHEIARAIDTGFYGVVLTAFNSSPLWRDALHYVIPAAAKQDMGMLMASPTQQGWLAARFDEDVNNGSHWLSPRRREQLKALYAFADEIKIDLPVLCLRCAYRAAQRGAIGTEHSGGGGLSSAFGSGSQAGRDIHDVPVPSL